MNKRKWLDSRNNDNALRFGYTLHDQSLLRETDPARTPTIQVWSGDDIDDSHTKTKYCPKCNCSMQWIAPIRQYGCQNCNTFVNEEWDHDYALSTNTPQGLNIPIDQRGPYIQLSDADEIPYIHSWSPMSQTGKDLAWDTTWSDNTGRVKTIHMKQGHPYTEYDIQEDMQTEQGGE